MNSNDAPIANGRTGATAPEVNTRIGSAETPVPAERPTPFAADRRRMEDFARVLEGWSFGREWLAAVFGRDPLVRRFYDIACTDMSSGESGLYLSPFVGASWMVDQVKPSEASGENPDESWRTIRLRGGVELRYAVGGNCSPTTSENAVST